MRSRFLLGLLFCALTSFAQFNLTPDRVAGFGPGRHLTNLDLTVPQASALAGVVLTNGDINVTVPGSAVARGLKARFKDAVNVKDFGAVGDGVTDDTAAIQSACVEAISNCKLVFPPGTYVITAPLELQGAVTVSGMGKVASQIKYAGAPSATPMLTIGGVVDDYTGYRVEHLTLNGNDLCPIFRARNRTDGSINDVWFYGATTYAARFDNSYYMQVSNCKFQRISGDAVILNGASANRFSDDTFHDIAGRAVYYEAAGNADFFTRDSFEFVGTAFCIPKNPSQLNVAIQGCYFEVVTNHFVIGETGSGTVPGPITIAGCVFAYTGSGYINFAGEISSLRFSENAIGPGVTISSNVENLFIGGNYYAVGGKTNNAQKTMDFDDAGAPSVSSNYNVAETVNAKYLNATNYLTARYTGGGELATAPTYSLDIQTTNAIQGQVVRVIGGTPHGVRFGTDSDGAMLNAISGGTNKPLRVWIDGSEMAQIKTNGFRHTAIPVYANNAAALSGGLVAGDFYRTGGDPDALGIVH